MTIPTIHLDTALAHGLKALLTQLSERLQLKRPLDVYLAGGMAAHLYTAGRVTTDVDAEFGKRILLPQGLVIDVVTEDGASQIMYFDTNYNSTFALMHEDYVEDSIPVDIGVAHINLRVLSPVDLVVSKLVRFSDNDKEDIQSLFDLGLVNADEVEARAKEALGGYIGDPGMTLLNLKEALQLPSIVSQPPSL